MMYHEWTMSMETDRQSEMGGQDLTDNEVSVETIVFWAQVCYNSVENGPRNTIIASA